ncbi:putative UV-damage endonuclease [Aeromonas phage avDM12-TAAL]|nr:putative UV-damage endonuclease [Aeromonas phage avDM12-TAAL]
MYGFACQMGEVVNGEFKQYKDTKFGTVRVCDMDKLGEQAAIVKLREKVMANLTALSNMVNRVAKLPDNQRLLRITSDLLPLYAHPKYASYYDSFRDRVILVLGMIGDKAKQAGIRLSMHPSQYTILNSDRPDVVDNALLDMEMHTFILKHLLVPKGEGIINIHLNGKTDVLPVDRMDDWMKSYVTFENDEKTGNLTRTLEICERYGFPVLLDIHHHYCNRTDGGVLLTADDPLVQRVKATWKDRPRRPKIHVSQSRGTENFRDMCAHSDIIDDANVIAAVRTFERDFDIMVEAKHKNVASSRLAFSL